MFIQLKNCINLIEKRIWRITCTLALGILDRSGIITNGAAELE